MKYILLCLLVGCSSTNSIEREPLSLGASRNFHADLHRVIDATTQSFPGVGLKLKYEKETNGATMLIAERGITGWSYGEVVRVVIQPFGIGTSVRILSQGSFKMNYTARDFTEDLFTRIGQRLGELP